MQFTFNEDELRAIGKHTQFGIYGGEDTEAVSYNYPITPKENMLRMLPCLLYTSDAADD